MVRGQGDADRALMKATVLVVAIAGWGAGVSVAPDVDAWPIAGLGAQAGARSVTEGVYTAAQAARGKEHYTARCASCHGSMASVTPDMAPLLNDHVFLATWKDLSVGDLFERIRNTMPQNEAGTLSPAHTAEIVAYILSGNRFPVGDAPLAEDADALKRIMMDVRQP